MRFCTTRRRTGPKLRLSAARAAGLKAIAVGADLAGSCLGRGCCCSDCRSAIGPIQVLVNNAAATQSKPFFETTEEDWAPQIDVTVGGTIRISHIVSKQMADNGGGNIINLMGDSGRVGESRLLVTAATRSSTIGLTKSLAKEMARHNIRANAVAIALVQTENLDEHTGAADDERMKKMLSMYPLRRLGRPDDVTPMILLLASPLSSWTTGQVIAVNGGYSMV